MMRVTGVRATSLHKKQHLIIRNGVHILKVDSPAEYFSSDAIAEVRQKDRGASVREPRCCCIEPILR